MIEQDKKSQKTAGIQAATPKTHQVGYQVGYQVGKFFQSSSHLQSSPLASWRNGWGVAWLAAFAGLTALGLPTGGGKGMEKVTLTARCSPNGGNMVTVTRNPYPQKKCRKVDHQWSSSISVGFYFSYLFEIYYYIVCFWPIPLVYLAVFCGGSRVPG